MRRQLIKYALKGFCWFENNWSLNIWQRIFYTVKIIVCIVLGREYKGEEWDWLGEYYVIVGRHSFEKFYNYELGAVDARFIDLTVGYGWRNWFYCELSNGWL
jgi:hypothetical protein